MAPSKLTAKQEAFALAYVETSNASEAYRQAYDVRPDTKPESIWQAASRILANDVVAARVMELQDAARERAMVTIEGLTEELEEARILAMSDEKGASAAVSAIMGKAKLHGLLVDKKEHSGTIGGDRKIEVEFVPALEKAKAIASVIDKGIREAGKTLPDNELGRRIAVLVGLHEQDLARAKMQKETENE